MSQDVRHPAMKPVLSVCIPAHNEEGNIGKVIDEVSAVLNREQIPFEFVIANDNSTDNTRGVIEAKMRDGVPIRLVNRKPPGGFGRAIRSCLENFGGDYVVIVMADLSDDPADIVKYYNTLLSGYDAVFGSRFVPGSIVKDYPRTKLVANRLGNKLIQFLFRTPHNDLTNAFKAFRGDAIRSLLPLYSSHFNITIEIALGLLIRRFRIASVPINWYGRTWGVAKFNIRQLSRRYFAVLFKVYAERIFILDDVMAEHDKKLRSVGASEEVITNISHAENFSYGWSGIRGI
jgi:dolichol-phosphate mannosyltransferase